MVKKRIKKVTLQTKKKAADLHREIKKHILAGLTAGFAFVIALFWRDAIQSFIDDFLSTLDLSVETYVYKIGAAVLVTILAAVGIMIAARFTAKD